MQHSTNAHKHCIVIAGYPTNIWLHEFLYKLSVITATTHDQTRLNAVSSSLPGDVMTDCWCGCTSADAVVSSVTSDTLFADTDDVPHWTPLTRSAQLFPLTFTGLQHSHTANIQPVTPAVNYTTDNVVAALSDRYQSASVVNRWAW